MLPNISNSQLRNERKFIFFEPHSSIEKLLNSIGAKEIYSPRNINSIYFEQFNEFFYNEKKYDNDNFKSLEDSE